MYALFYWSIRTDLRRRVLQMRIVSNLKILTLHVLDLKFCPRPSSLPTRLLQTQVFEMPTDANNHDRKLRLRILPLCCKRICI